MLAKKIHFQLMAWVIIGVNLLAPILVRAEVITTSAQNSSTPITTFQLTGPASDASDPFIYWNKNRHEYVVVWADNRIGNYRIYFTRLDSTGKRLMTNDVQINPGMGWAFKPTINWNGKEYLVIWRDDRSKVYNLYGQRVDALGNLIGRDVQLRSGIWHAYNADLLYNSQLGQYALTWDDVRAPFGTSGIYLAQLTPEGKKLETELPITDTQKRGDSYSPSIAWNGREYLIVWQDNSDGYKYKLLRMLVEPNGIKHSTDGEQILDSNRQGWASDPRLSANNNGFGMVYTIAENEGKQIFFAQLDNKGQLIRERVVTDSLLKTNQETLTSSQELFFRRFPYLRSTNITYTVGNATDIYRSEKADMAWTGNSYGIVWQDNRYGNYEILFTEIDSEGNPLRNEFLRLSNTIGNSADARMTFNGSGYAVTWRDVGNDTKIEKAHIMVSLIGNQPAQPTATIPQTPVKPTRAEMLTNSNRPKLESGTLIQGTGKTIYRIGTDGLKHAYPDYLTFALWGNSQNKIKRVSDEVLNAIPLGVPNPLPTRSRIVKFKSAAQLYSVEGFYLLRYIPSEKTARSIYGSNWKNLIIVLPDTAAENYTIGESMETKTILKAASR